MPSLPFCPWSSAGSQPPAICPQPLPLSCGDFGSCMWMDGQKSPPPPTSDCSGQHSTPTSQESEARSRAGERILSPPCFFSGPADRFFIWELHELEGKRGDGFTAIFFQEEKINQIFSRKLIVLCHVPSSVLFQYLPQALPPSIFFFF